MNNSISSSSSSSIHGPAGGEDVPDATTLAILSAESWEVLYDLYYNSSSSAGSSSPTHQHCYSYLTALSELLPELDPPAAAAVAASGISLSSSSGSSATQDLDSGWEALRAAGKVVSWSQLTALRVSESVTVTLFE